MNFFIQFKMRIIFKSFPLKQQQQKSIQCRVNERNCICLKKVANSLNYCTFFTFTQTTSPKGTFANFFTVSNFALGQPNSNQSSVKPARRQTCSRRRDMRSKLLCILPHRKSLIFEKEKKGGHH